MMNKMHAEPSLGSRANAAYVKNKVWKDSHNEGNGGAEVDEKRVLDISEERLEIIKRSDDNLLSGEGVERSDSNK